MLAAMPRVNSENEAFLLGSREAGAWSGVDSAAATWVKERVLFGEAYEGLALVKEYEKMDRAVAMRAEDALADLPMDLIETRKGKVPTWDVCSEEVEP